MTEDASTFTIGPAPAPPPEPDWRADEALAARQAAAEQERAANRQGPTHPAHWQHDQWLEDRGLTRDYDKR